MTTRKKIAEQVLFRLKGSYPTTAMAVQLPDVIEAAGQVINTVFKMQHFSMTLNSGETIPENLMIATYTGITVSSWMDKSKAILPTLPVSLPRNQGIDSVFVSGKRTGYDIASDIIFIPMQAGQSDLLRVQTLINSLFGQIGYTPYGKEIIFEKDLTMYGVTALTFRLVVMDMSQYSDTDMLPIPADYEAQVVTELYNQFVVIAKGEKIVDAYAPTSK